jgi:hypothetical protein
MVKKGEEWKVITVCKHNRDWVHAEGAISSGSKRRRMWEGTVLGDSAGGVWVR